MRGRKPQPLPPINRYAMIPQFVYALLSDGVISPSAFTLWATIRLFARDQERNVFSPGLVELTTAQLAQSTGLSETQVKRWLRELENAGLLERYAGSNTRQLQLRAPAGITRRITNRLIDQPVGPQEEDLVFFDLEAPPPEALSPEGGAGETNYRADNQPVGQPTGRTTNPLINQPVGQPTRRTTNRKDNQPVEEPPSKAAIVAVLRERGAFPKVADTIADTLIAAGIIDPDEVRDLVTAVIQQVHAEGAKETQVIGRVMARLRNGDWDMEAVRAQAVAEARTAAYARYTTANPSNDEGEGDAAEDADDTPQPVATRSSLARSAEAAELWQKTLNAIRLNTTAEIYNTWFSRSRGMGYNGDGNTLVIAAHNATAAEMLESRLAQLIQRELANIAGVEVPVRFVVAGDAA
ncbi:MAG: chromosomal replication initiation protein [Chloroflexi bacterium ADurb.Bin360]|nr:MAG: chromosomal replication initiation protein [Chloroflexi bacterium ADurb.Bin360]